MTYRHSSRLTLFGLLLAACLPLAAQEVDDIEPGVNTSPTEPVQETSATEPAEAEALEPAVQTTPNTASQSRALDSLQLDSSQITGNQELPQVLYIVPWKTSDLGDLVGRPVNTLLDEVLAPADREVFIRQIEYYDDLHGDNEEDS